MSKWDSYYIYTEKVRWYDSSNTRNRSDLVPTIEGDEPVIECVLKDRKTGTSYQLSTLLKGSHNHDSVGQQRGGFVDKDGRVNDRFM